MAKWFRHVGAVEPQRQIEAVRCSRSEPRDEGDQSHQILDPELSSARSDRVRGDEARPARGERRQVSLSIAVEDPVLTPVRPMIDEVDLLPGLRVERMRYANNSRRFMPIPCS